MRRQRGSRCGHSRVDTVVSATSRQFTRCGRGDGVLEKLLVKLQLDDDTHVWPAEQFEPVAAEVERVFEQLGLTQLSLPLAA